MRFLCEPFAIRCCSAVHRCVGYFEFFCFGRCTGYLEKSSFTLLKQNTCMVKVSKNVLFSFGTEITNSVALSIFHFVYMQLYSCILCIKVSNPIYLFHQHSNCNLFCAGGGCPPPIFKWRDRKETQENEGIDTGKPEERQESRCSNQQMAGSG